MAQSQHLKGTLEHQSMSHTKFVSHTTSFRKEKKKKLLLHHHNKNLILKQ